MFFMGDPKNLSPPEDGFGSSKDFSHFRTQRILQIDDLIVIKFFFEREKSPCQRKLENLFLVFSI